MVAQRVFGIALGYEDLIDHDQLLGRLVGERGPNPVPAAKRSGARDAGRQARGQT
jgi:hypothetical protein